MENFDVYSRKFNNGLSLLFLKTNSRKATISAIVKAGSYFEPPEKVGISHIIEHISSKNHDGFSSYVEYQKFLDDNYVQTFAFTERNHIFFKSTVDVSKFRLAIDAIYRNLMFNNLNKETLDWGREGVLIEESGYMDNPIRQTLLEHDNHLWSDVYPQLDVSPGGSPITISNITDNDIIKFKKLFFDAKNVTIVIAGNLDFSKVSDYLTSRFETIPSESDNPPLHYDVVDFPSPVQEVLEIKSNNSLKLTYASMIYFFEMPKIKSGILFIEIYKRFLKKAISNQMIWEDSLVYDFSIEIEVLGHNMVIRALLKTKSSKIKDALDNIDQVVSSFQSQQIEFVENLQRFKAWSDTSFWSKELALLSLYDYPIPVNISKFFDEDIVKEFLSWRSSLKMKKQTLIYSSESVI